MSGICIFGRVSIIINDPMLLEEVYVKQNKWFTKHANLRNAIIPLIQVNITGMDTHEPDYAPRRKSLSSAFFSSKLHLMTTVIKEVTI